MVRFWLLLSLAFTASAQTSQFSFSFNLSGTGYGIPGEQASDTTGSLVVTANGKTTTIPLDFAGIDGEFEGTELRFSLATATHDILSWEDNSPSLNNLGRSGTATLKYGTDSFRSAYGTMSYTFTCVSSCSPSGVSVPEPGKFGFMLTGTGTLTLTAADANAALPLLFPPPPTGIMVYINGILTLITPPDPNAGNVVQAHAAVDSSSAGSISIGLPLETTDSTYRASANCANASAACWLSVPSATGSIPAFTETSIAASYQPTGLPAGVYPANVAVTVTPQSGVAATQNVPATLVVNRLPQLQLSESSIQFQALAGSGQKPVPHSITVSDSGVAYQASASTLSGANWLSVSQGSGQVTISADPTGLTPGTYFGKVDIAAPGALGSPQSVPVQLTVSANGATPLFSTTSVTFITPQNGNPASQAVTISTFSSAPLAFTSKADVDGSVSWLSVSGSAAVVQSSQPATETISVSTKGLAPGVYTGKIQVEATAAKLFYPIQVLLIVTPAGTCTPTKLLPAFTNLTEKFEFPAARPVSLQAQVIDDCGNPLKTGNVQMSFSDPSDSPTLLTSLGNGQWTGTWTPHGVVGRPASIELNAQSAAGLAGSVSVAGTVDANPKAVILDTGGVVSSASFGANTPVAPGAFVSIFGTNLAPATASSPGFPFQTQLAGTRVLLGGVPMPLQFVSGTVINAIVPFGTPVNSIQELLIEQNGVYSQPESVIVAGASPAVFTQAQTGQGLGAIVVIKPDNSYFIASASQAATAGDILSIYCAGLGAVNATVADGAAAPDTGAKTLGTVTVTIGGKSANVLYAGLAPEFAGLYQVNVTVPGGITPGTDVPVVLTEGGASSPPVTLAIR